MPSVYVPKHGATYLHNDVHGTTVRINAAPGKRLSVQQLKRVLGKLCPVKGCRCRGIEGPQRYTIEGDTLVDTHVRG